MSTASQNARTHGFTAAHIALTPEERPEFEAFRDSLLAEFAPFGAVEEILFRRLLHAAWNLEMLDRAEAALFSNIADAILNDDNEKMLARITRYRATHLRVFQYTRRTLEYEQTERALRQIASRAGQSSEPDSGATAPPPAPRANFRQINHFTKQDPAANKFGSFPAEMRDRLWAMDIEARYLSAQYRQMKSNPAQDLAARHAA